MGALVKWITNRVKPSQVAVKSVGDLHKLAQIAEIVHGWSAKDGRQAHLHLHDVGRLVQSSVQRENDTHETIDTTGD